MRLCAGCGATIAPGRILALPRATLCVGCAQKPYTRPEAPVFPPGQWKLLSEATEAPVLREQEPEKTATERAEASLYRQIESLDENEDLTSGHDSGTL